MAPARGEMRDGAHHFPVRVYYEDTDIGGIVYHANYLKFMERGRTEFLRHAGVDQGAARTSAAPYQFAVAEMAIAFKKPATLDDTLDVRTRIRDVRRASLILAQEIWRDGTLIADATVRVGCIQPDGRVKRLPGTLYMAFRDFMIDENELG